MNGHCDAGYVARSVVTLRKDDYELEMCRLHYEMYKRLLQQGGWNAWPIEAEEPKKVPVKHKR